MSIGHVDITPGSTKMMLVLLATRLDEDTGLCIAHVDVYLFLLAEGGERIT